MDFPSFPALLFFEACRLSTGRGSLDDETSCSEKNKYGIDLHFNCPSLLEAAFSVSIEVLVSVSAEASVSRSVGDARHGEDVARSGRNAKLFSFQTRDLQMALGQHEASKN